MNLIGERVEVLASTDKGKVGRSGTILLETARTLVVDSAGRTIRVEKLGAAFRLLNSEVVVTGADIAGRLEDRWGRKAR